MKTVFIFGAGASRDAGGPLMSDFFDKADKLRRHNKVSDAIKEFDDVFSAISELQAVYAKSYLDLDNLETLFGAIELGRRVWKFADREPAAIEGLRDSMIILYRQNIGANYSLSA